MSNKFLSSVLGLALLTSATNLNAQATDYATISCPSDATIECGQNIQDYDLTGIPSVQLLVGASYDLVSSDAVVSSNDCTTVIARTWTAELNELGGSLGSVSCTQIITVRDTQAPVISGIPVGVTVDCIDAIPAPSTSVTAVDACAGSVPVTSFQSASGSLISSCTLTTAFGPGTDWSIWLFGLAEQGLVSSPYFNFQAPGATFEQYADNTAHLTGTLVNAVNPNERFQVDWWFQSKRNWNDWSNAGGPGSRSYKNDLNLSCADNNHEIWSYYEMVGGFSTLTGEGDLAGDQLSLQHQPVNYYYGFQVGVGANNKNCNNGISGWFSYSGFVNNIAVSANGDINCDAACEPQENVCDNRTSVTYLYRAEDACGRASVATQTVNVFDDVAPTFVNCPANITIECTDPIPVAPNNIEATDNCSGFVAVVYLGETLAGEGCTSSITRNWIAEDECGNRSNCTQTITITDTQAPVLSGTPDATVTAQCDNVPAAATVNATDNCDQNVTVNFTETSASGDCVGRYTITRTWSATDDCGNTSSFTQTVNVVDTTAPVFDAFPIYISAECNETTPMPTATDNCSGVNVTIYSDVLNSGGCLGVITRTYRAIDGCGNYSDLIQFITLTDTTAPSLNNVPAETSLQCDQVTMGSNGNYFDVAPVTASDNCDNSVEIAYSENVVATDDNCPNSFDIIRTWIAIDECENADTANQVVHIIDTTSPIFIGLPETLTFNCDDVIPVLPTPVAQDNCSETTVTFVAQDTIFGSCPQNYTIIRIFRATDGCGNEAMESQTIIVSDIQAPVFSENNQVEFTYECNSDNTVVQPTATDNCGNVTYTFANGEPSGNGCNQVFVRTWTATDECGNASTFAQTIQLIDTTAPVITGDLETSRPCDDYAGIYVEATDNCNEYNVTYTDEMVSGPCAGNVIRHYTATDICGNVSVEFTQIIHLTDVVSPTIASQAENMTVECDSEYSVAPAQFTDNCDQELEITSDFSSETVGCTTIETYTWTATDHCGNSTTATTVVTIVDTTNPYFTSLPENVTVNCNETIPGFGEYAAADNCDSDVAIAAEESRIDGNCPQTYTMVRTYLATDNCGNQTVETRYVYVVDTQAPSFEEQINTFTYECGEEIEVVEPIATDNCGNVSYTYDDGEPSANGCNQVIVRTWTATDECGNASTFDQTINIVDTTAPVISGDIETTKPCDNNGGNYITVVETCNSYTVSKTDVFVSGGCAGTLIRTYVATDACGNASAPFTQFIHLTDDVAPTASPATSNITVNCDEAIPAFTPQFTDNCDDDLTIVALPDSTIEGNCPSESTIIRRVRATDSCDNSVVATQTVNVVDDSAPVWGSENNSEFVYECGTEAAVSQPIATDNCSTITYSYTNGPTSVVGCNERFNRTWIATDACGNASTPFVQLIRFVDTIAPTIDNCPSDIELGCEDAVPTPVDVTASDDCDDNVTVTYNQFIFGEQNEPGVLANCDITTPVHATGGNCGVNLGGVDIDWAMQLNGMPSLYRYYALSEGSLVRYADEIHLTATMTNVLDATSGFFVDVTFEGGWDWTTWSTLLGNPASYKADCINVGNSYEQWLYFLLSGQEGAELVGFGNYAGSSLNLTHAPSNNYFGFQYGDGANNFDAAFGFGGWFNYSGIFQSSQTAAPSQLSGAGDFALDLDCCPDFWIVRQWTATDCSGNSSTCSQIISYPDSNPVIENTGADLSEQFTEALEDIRVVAGEVAVSPNPVRNIAQFNFKTVNNATTTLEIFDMSGRKVADVYSGTVEAGSAYQVSFDTEALATGIYMYRFTNGSDVQIKRLIINK